MKNQKRVHEQDRAKTPKNKAKKSRARNSLDLLIAPVNRLLTADSFTSQGWTLWADFECESEEAKKKTKFTSYIFQKDGKYVLFQDDDCSVTELLWGRYGFVIYNPSYDVVQQINQLMRRGEVTPPEPMEGVSVTAPSPGSKECNLHFKQGWEEVIESLNGKTTLLERKGKYLTIESSGSITHLSRQEAIQFFAKNFNKGFSKDIIKAIDSYSESHPEMKKVA